MDKEARCAFIHAQSACAMAEIAAMQASNEVCKLAGVAPGFTHDDFMSIQARYMIGHNEVIQYLRS